MNAMNRSRFRTIIIVKLLYIYLSYPTGTIADAFILSIYNIGVTNKKLLRFVILKIVDIFSKYMTKYSTLFATRVLPTY